MNDFNTWLDEVAESSVKCRHEIVKEAIGNNRQDMSRPVLEDLLNQGYEVVEWDSGRSVHSVCRELNHQQWSLQDFVSNLNHDAPIFEKSHPGDANCRVMITGPGLTTVYVDSYGNVEEI